MKANNCCQNFLTQKRGEKRGKANRTSVSKYHNLKSGPTSIAQANFVRRDLFNIYGSLEKLEALHLWTKRMELSLMGPKFHKQFLTYSNRLFFGPQILIGLSGPRQHITITVKASRTQEGPSQHISWGSFPAQVRNFYNFTYTQLNWKAKCMPDYILLIRIVSDNWSFQFICAIVNLSH